MVTTLPRLVVFDLDGTLIDAFGGIHDAMAHTMRVFGYPPHDFATVKAMVGHGLDELLAKAMSPVLVEATRPVYRARYSEIAVSSALPLAGAARLIEALAARGVVLALASNKPSYFSERILTGLGWRQRFAHVLGPDLAKRTKPDPRMVELILERSGIGAEEALYVGDMTVDLETARACAMPFILVATGSMDFAALSAAAPGRVVPDLAALAAALGV